MTKYMLYSSGSLFMGTLKTPSFIKRDYVERLLQKKFNEMSALTAIVMFSSITVKVKCTLVQTTALEGDEGPASRPGRSLPPGKTRYPMYRRLDGLQDQFGRVRKISSLPGFDSRTIEAITNRYTDDAIRVTSTIYLAILYRILILALKVH